MELPKGYSLPKQASKYTKFEEGVTRLRILSNPAIGWLDWKDKKPLRFEYANKPNQPVNPEKPIKHFWAFKVWNYETGQIQIWEVTQSTIQKKLMSLKMDEDWGDPDNYDIKVSRQGKDLETTYEITPCPNSQELDEEVVKEHEAVQVDLSKLFAGMDPFEFEPTSKEEGLSNEEIPF
jgi:hypothetical protein